jgi:lipopolysaccharide exporter
LKNLTTRTIHGISWNLVATVSNTVLQIGYTAIMARLLSPTDFGLMAMAMVVVKFGDYFSKMGMAHALVQKQDLTNDDIRSVFTTSVLIGLLFTGLMYFFAPWFEYVFDSEKVIPVIKVLSINFLLNGLSITSLGLLGKELEFKKLAIIDMTAFLLCNMGIGIYLAYSGFGVFSLVYAGIAQQIIMLIISFGLIRHDIRPLFNWKVYKPLLIFGSRISLISFLEYIGGNLDTFLIAKFHGAANVGLYSKARMLVFLPAYRLSRSMTSVIFPAFSKIQNNMAKLGNAYISSITLMSAILFPICFGVFAASKEIILVILGEQWTDAIPILQIFSFVVPLQLISGFGGILCDATAKLNIKFIFQSSYVVLVAVLFYIFRKQGIYIYPMIILFSVFMKNIGYILLSKKILSLKLHLILSAYFPGFLIGIAVLLGISISTMLLNVLALPLLVTLIIKMIVGFLILSTLGILFPFGRLKIVLIERLKSLKISNKITVLLARLKWIRKESVFENDFYR